MNRRVDMRFKFFENAIAFTVSCVFILLLSQEGFTYPSIRTYLGKSFLGKSAENKKQCEDLLPKLVATIDHVKESGIKVVHSQCRENENSYQIEIDYGYQLSDPLYSDILTPKSQNSCSTDVLDVRQRLSEAKNSLYLLDVYCKPDGENERIQIDYFNPEHLVLVQIEYPLQFSKHSDCEAESSRLFKSISSSVIFALRNYCRRVTYSTTGEISFRSIVDYYKPIYKSIRTEIVLSTTDKTECVHQLEVVKAKFNQHKFTDIFLACTLEGGLFMGVLAFVETTDRSLSFVSPEHFYDKKTCEQKGELMSRYYEKLNTPVVHWSCTQQYVNGSYDLLFFYYYQI